MVHVSLQGGYEEWREEARRLIHGGVDPRDVVWGEAGLFEGLLEVEDADDNLVREDQGMYFSVPREFVRLARSVACHRDERRWAFLYEVLWRIVRLGERSLLANDVDGVVRELRMMAKAVSRDIHKMRAFVRFRQVDVLENGREVYAGWFEPEHLIVRANAEFFRKRFAGMNWTILTPDECASWDGDEVFFSEGVSKDEAPGEDELEDLWRTYYQNIFNPARVKLKMMQSEMPKKYWKNLPEAQIIRDLVDESGERVRKMMNEENRPLKAPPKNSYLKRLGEMD